MSKIIFSLCVILLACSTSFAQRETANGVGTDKDIALLRRDLRAEKKQALLFARPASRGADAVDNAVVLIGVKNQQPAIS